MHNSVEMVFFENIAGRPTKKSSDKGQRPGRSHIPSTPADHKTWLQDYNNNQFGVANPDR